MMKRFLSILLALALCTAVTGCGRMQADEDNDSSPGSKITETLKKGNEEPIEKDQANETTGEDTHEITPAPAYPSVDDPGEENADEQPSRASIDFEYEKHQDGLMITRYTGVSSEVVIPDEIDGMAVTGIGEDAFLDCPNLTGITISSSVSEFWLSTFTSCKNLKSITVDRNNSNYASEEGILFDKHKTRLICYPAGRTNSSTIIPDGVVEIGICAFSRNPYIKSVIIPDSVRRIELEAFAHCTALENIILPEGLEDIDDSAFSGCSNLKAPDQSRTDDGDDYILPMSSLRPLTYSDIEDLSKEEIAYARNEIYARHGYVFQKQKYKDYFGTKSWYRPDPDFKESDLSEIEKGNVDFLLQYEGQ